MNVSMFPTFEVRHVRLLHIIHATLEVPHDVALELHHSYREENLHQKILKMFIKNSRPNRIMKIKCYYINSHYKHTHEDALAAVRI